MTKVSEHPARIRRRPPLDRDRPLVWHHWPADAGLDAAAPPGAAELRGLPCLSGALSHQTVVCVGLGAIGARVFTELPRVGLGRVYGIDLDRYGPESYRTQPMRRRADRWRSKAVVQGRAAHAANPACEVTTLQGMAQDVPWWVYRRADLVVLAGDNAELAAALGARLLGLGRPLVELSVYGEALAAIVRVFDDPAAACPACTLTPAEWADLKGRHGCDPSTMRALGQEPTRTPPMICGLAADLGLVEVLKRLAGADPAQRLASEELLYTAASHRVLRTRLEQNPHCPCEHLPWRLIDEPRAPAEVTLGELIADHQRRQREAGPAPPAGELLQIRGEATWISYTLCGSCDARHAVRRFGAAGEDLGRCACGDRLTAVPLGVRRVLPLDDVQARRDCTLDRLGVVPGGAVGLACDDLWTYYFVGRPATPAELAGG